MPAIAAASGITAGAIYKHFDSKAALFFEVVRRTVEAAALPTARSESRPVEAGLPALVGADTTRRLKRLRQLAVEMHYASARDPAVRRLLRSSLEAQIGGLAAELARAPGGRADAAADRKLMAPMIFVVIMGLMHMETLLPQLVDDVAWRRFVESRVAAILGET